MIKNRFHAFLDESYGKNDYYMAAIVLDDQRYNILVRNLESVVAHAHEKFNIPITTELHAHRMMPRLVRSDSAVPIFWWKAWTWFG